MAYLTQDDYFWIHPLIFKFYNFISLKLLNSVLLCECTVFSLAIHWLIDINPSCFQVLHITNRTVMKMREKGSLEYDLDSFAYTLKSYELRFEVYIVPVSQASTTLISIVVLQVCTSTTNE